MEINLILLVPNAMMLGWQYYEPDETLNIQKLICFYSLVRYKYDGSNYSR